MINPYVYTKQSDGFNSRLIEESKLGLRYSVSFPSAQTDGCLGNNPVKGEFLLPKVQGKMPLAILVHGMGGSSVSPCRKIAGTLAQKGIASFILYLIFHKNRAHEIVQKKYPNLTTEEWFESYRISVTEVRQVMDWAGSRPEILQDQVSVVGISYGSFVSSIAMALDDRLKSGVFIVSGGNSEKLTKNSLFLRWQYKCNKAEYLKNQENYQQYLAEVAEKGFENAESGKKIYLTDPMTFATYLKNRPVMMLNALWDEMIPKSATLDLWQSYGKPPIYWYPATHASIWLWYPLMGSRIADFLKLTSSS
jgi:cephalosporin-C deacetylase-like acetyl esterase